MRESSPDQITYKEYVIWIRSYEMKPEDGYLKPWSSCLKRRGMGSKSSNTRLGQRWRCARRRMPKRWLWGNSGLMNGWRGIGTIESLTETTIMAYWQASRDVHHGRPVGPRPIREALRVRCERALRRSTIVLTAKRFVRTGSRPYGRTAVSCPEVCKASSSDAAPRVTPPTASRC
jgi:hypothetical protein